MQCGQVRDLATSHYSYELYTNEAVLARSYPCGPDESNFSSP